MKQRTYRPVESAEPPAPTPLKPVKVNPLAVAMPLPEYSDAPQTTPVGVAPKANEQPAGDGQATAQLRMIDARHIEQNAHPPRQIYNDQAITDLADSMKKDGQRDPIHVIEHPSKPGRYIIGDGWTRVQAIRAHEINGGMVLARIHAGLTEEEASWLGYSQNERRSQHTDFDRAMYYQNWYKGGLSWDEIAKRSGKSKALLSFYASYSKLPSEILSAAHTFPDKITATVAQQLVRAVELGGESKAMLLTSRFISDDKPQKWLKEEVIKLSVERKQRVQKPQVNFQQRFGGDGSYRQRTDGHIELSASIPPDRAEEFNARIVALLNEFVDHEQSAPEGQGPAGLGA